MGNVLDLKNQDVVAPEVQEPTPEAEPVLASFFSTPETAAWTIEHQRTERGRSREYMFLAGVAITGGLISWWQSSWLTCAVIVLGIAAWELHSRLPSTHRVEIDAKGISINGYRHEYARLHSYDIHAMPDGSTHLSIKTTRWHIPHLHLALGDQDPGEINAVLSRYLLQGEHKIPLLEWFLKRP